MNIRTAAPDDLPALREHDRHISAQVAALSIQLNRVYIAEEQGKFLGWLRYNLFWDNTPFMNLLCVLEEHRGRGVGKALVEYWEGQMGQAGYGMVMTSTQSNEYAQHFYGRLGYAAIGGFLLPGEPYELILAKQL